MIKINIGCAGWDYSDWRDPFYPKNLNRKCYLNYYCSGTITIPISIAEALNWKHKDDVNLVIKNIDGKIGLFMYKKEK